VRAHADDLQLEVGDRAWVDAVAADFHTAPLSPRQSAICRYSEKLTLTPSAMTAGDLDELRAHGLADPDLLDLVQVVAFFNSINRVVDALGVPDEPEWKG